MRCPECSYEPRDRLLSRPCPECGHEWWDTEDYVRWLAQGLEVRSALDVGCGRKGVIGLAYWQEIGIERGYACDAWDVLALPPPWVPLVCDARALPERIGAVGFATHCGLLEHVDYAGALDVVHAIELVSEMRVFVTASAELRDVDYKVRRDGNQFHYYKSFWCGPVFEALGYTVDRARMADGRTFNCEVVAWCEPTALDDWEERRARAVAALLARRCSTCGGEPMQYRVTPEGDDRYACIEHADASAYESGRAALQDPLTTGNFPRTVLR